MRRTADQPADDETAPALRDASPDSEGKVDPARALAGRLLRSPTRERMGPAARQRVWAGIEQGQAPSLALRFQVARVGALALVVFGSLAVAMATVGRWSPSRSERSRATVNDHRRASAATETPPPPASSAPPVAAPSLRSVVPSGLASPAEDARAIDGADDEIGLVYAARVARQPGESLRLVDEYLARFPRGQLRSEAMMVGVAAALSGGREESARRLAARYLAESPDGPHRETAKRVLGPH